MLKVQKLLMLTDKGYKDLKRGILACTLTNFSRILPFAVIMMSISEMLRILNGEDIRIEKLILYLCIGILSTGIIFLAGRNDYKKTYISAYRQSMHTRIEIAEHLRKLPMSFFDAKDLSELSSHFMGDIASCEQVMSHLIPQLTANCITVGIVCFLLAFREPRLAAAIFCTVPMAFLLIFMGKKVQTVLGERHGKAKLRASKEVQEFIDGIKVIKACNLDSEKFSALRQALADMRRLAVQYELNAGICVAGAQTVLQLGIGITVLLSAKLLTGREISFLTLIVFMMIVTRVYGPILTELTLLPELLYHRIAIERIYRLMLTAEVSGKDIDEIKTYTINLENVSFKYPTGTKKAICDVSTVISQGDITALVGASGSGKTTLAKLIGRFGELEHGRITIGGIDIKNLKPEHLLSYISFVFQDVILFDDTVYNNIRIGKADASEDEVKAAAAAACCQEFIERLPQGYDTILGENGAMLSGGERQRISIARALLKNAPIVILDEATSSLDAENSGQIQSAVSRLINNKTVLVIAHCLNTIMNADHIIVLEDGKIAEEGNHSRLMENKGLYRKLFDIEKKSMEWSI